MHWCLTKGHLQPDKREAPEGLESVGDGRVQNDNDGHLQVIQGACHCEPSAIRPPLCDHHAELDALHPIGTLPLLTGRSTRVFEFTQCCSWQHNDSLDGWLDCVNGQG